MSTATAPAPTDTSTEDELVCCFIAADTDEICRECSCTPDRACVRAGEVCGWAEPGLCTACAPDAGEGWNHPDRETLGCQEAAEFEIRDLADADWPDGRQITHACTEHVGELLGHGDDVPEDADDRWEVRAL